MASILLINPSFGYYLDKEYSESLPIGLLCLGTFLKENKHKVVLLDFLTQDNFKEKFNEEIVKNKYIGFSVMTQQVPHALRLSKIIKERFPEKVIIWGCVHVALFPEQVAKSEYVDYIIPLEGEFPLLELVNSLENKKNVDSVKGIGYYENNQLKLTPKSDFIDMEKLPFVDFNLMEANIRDMDFILIHSSRGCPFRCTFCINNIIGNRKWRSINAKMILDYIEYALPFFNKRHIKFRDELFFFNKERIKQFVQGAIDRNLNITWEATCRVSYFNDKYIDREFLKLMKQSGCVKLWFGAESGSQKVLDIIKKDIKVFQIIKSAKILTNSGIVGIYSFMCGLPGETKRDMSKTLKVIDRLLKINKNIEIIGPQAYRPYPGGDLYDYAIKSGWPEPKTLDGWDESMKREEYLVAKKFYPWVKDPIHVQSLIIYTMFGAYPFKRALNEFDLMKTNVPKLFAVPFILLQQLRWKLKMFDYPLEIIFANKILRRKNN